MDIDAFKQQHAEQQRQLDQQLSNPIILIGYIALLVSGPILVLSLAAQLFQLLARVCTTGSIIYF